MTSDVALSRRSFLASVGVVGGGLALGLAIPFEPVSAADEISEITVWLLIGPDNSVLIRVARSEMGQGAQTGLAMLVAEELECDWSNVRIESVTPEDNLRRQTAWGDMQTGASRSIATSQLYLRQAGAAAREMLIAAAAARLNVSAKECVARKGSVVHKPAAAALTFGAVAGGGRKTYTAHQRRIKRSRRLVARRYAAATARHARQGDGAAHLCRRCAIARHALRRHCPLSGIWRIAEVRQ